MTVKTSKLQDAIKFALLVGASTALAAGHAVAQDQSEQEQPTATTLDTVTVTGTRIQSQTITASSPVAEITREEFQYTGATRVDDLVNQYPQMSPYFDSFANNPSTGYPTVDLRGMGAQRTLTLVNGHRLPPGGLEVRDISIIPAALVQRVDLLTGGASAVYGSDAIAGVVNFILDDEFEGWNLSAGWSAYRHKNDNEYIQGLMDRRGFSYPTGDSGFDGISRNIDIAFGKRFADGIGHITSWLTWRENDALFHGDRDYSSCALNARATACGGSPTNATGNFYAFQTDPNDPSYFDGTPASLNPDGSWRNSYGAPYNYAPPNYYQRPDERVTFGTSIKLDISDNFQPYLDLMMLNRKDALQIAESGTFFALVDDLNCSTPFLGSLCQDLGFDPTLPVGVYVAKRNVEGGPRRTETNTNSSRIVAGVEGAITDDWSYNTSFLFGHNNYKSQGFNDFLFSRIVDALRQCPPGSFSGCVPYNVWVPGGVTPQAAAALAGISSSRTQTEMTVFNAYVSGDTGFGFGSAKGDTVQLVGGVEWRKETYDFTADPDSQAGNFAGSGGASRPVSGSTKVSEVFLESAVPLLTDFGFLRRLNLDLGYRRSEYDLAGSANTYKIGFGADMGAYRLRGGFNRAIRAPNINELFDGQGLALWGGSDPCAGPTPTFTPAQCANTGVPASRYGLVPANSAGQYNQLTGGNLELRPEAADTWTLGFVATPLEGLTFNVDYYDIRLEDAIDSIGASTILTFCGLTGDPFLCNRVRRNATSGDLFRGNDIATAGHIVNTLDNFGEQRFRGVDLGASYGWNMFAGRMLTSFQGSYALEREIAPLPGLNEDATYDCAGKINVSCQVPEWRHIANMRYSMDAWTVNLRWRHIGDMDYVDTDGTPLTTDTLLAPSGKLKAQNYLDLSGSIKLGSITEWTLGVNNIADKEPPMVGVDLALNANAPGGYDQAGRYFFTTVNFRF
jgi:iron complex outermembrane recepter protein